MVVAHLAMYGAQVSIAFSLNPKTGVQKAKVVIDPSSRVEPNAQGCLLSALDLLADMGNRYHLADRGHRHSGGKSEISFYITMKDDAVRKSMGTLNPAAAEFVPGNVASAGGANVNSVVEDEDVANGATQSAEQLVLADQHVDDLEILLPHISSHVEVVMQKARGSSPSWPPIRDMCAEEGCRVLHELAREEITATIASILEEQHLPKLSAAQVAMLQEKLSQKVELELEKWKATSQISETT